MAIMTETELRDRIRRPRSGLAVTVPPGTSFSPAAQDFIEHWQLEIMFSEGAQVGLAGGDRPAWETAAEFPLQREGALPTCTACGMPVTSKPEHLTQLDAEHYAPKNTPRIRFRGRMDTLHGLVLLAGAQAMAENHPEISGHLDTLAAYCREIVSAEYNDRPVEPLTMAGVDEDTLRKATHDPDEAVGLPHVVPTAEGPLLLLWLNYLRGIARETELAALDAFAGGPAHTLTHPTLVKAMNRLSSAVYYLELLLVKGQS